MTSGESVCSGIALGITLFNSKDKQEVFVKDSYVGYHAFLDYSVQMALTGYSRYLNVLDAFKPGQTYPDFMAFYIFRPGRAGDFIFLDIAP